jgi:hypothetical protein
MPAADRKFARAKKTDDLQDNAALALAVLG